MPTNLMFGSPVAQAGFGMANQMGPFWQQQQMVPHVGQAYSLASQLLAPGFQGAGQQQTPWGDMLMKMIGPRAQSAHPGMGDAQWNESMKQIMGSAENEKAKAMSLLGSTGGGSVDPRAASAALTRIQEGVPSAVSNLAAQRQKLDLQAMLGLGGLQQPLARQELQNQYQQGQQYGSELRGLAGNILQGGTYMPPNQAALQATQGPTWSGGRISQFSPRGF